MSNKVEMTGKRFGRLIVIRESLQRLSGVIAWDCLCDCGKIKSITGKSMRSGMTKSCGCLQAETISKLLTTHGMKGSETYNVWVSMIQRCTNPKNSRYEDYGGRNIAVCQKWLKFENFFKDMGTKPQGLTIERRNNDLGYFKENCSWNTYLVQAKNQRIRKDNSTGITGVGWNKRLKKYRVRITANQKKYHIGVFDNLEDAKIARSDAELKYWGRDYVRK